MTLDTRLRDLREMEERVGAMLSKHDADLKGSGGGGTSGGMEARVAKLEASVSHIERDVGEMRGDLKTLSAGFARIEERVAHLPTKGFIFSVSVGLLAAVGAIVALVVRFIPHAG